MGICACQAKKGPERIADPPGLPIVMNTRDVHVRERERGLQTETDRDENFLNVPNNPSVRPTLFQGNGSECAGSESKGSGGSIEESNKSPIPFSDGSTYRVGQSLYQKHKVRVYQCMQSTGKFITMKYVYVSINLESFLKKSVYPRT